MHNRPEAPVSLAIQKCCDIFDAIPIIHNLTSNVLHTGFFFNWASPEFAKCWPVSIKLISKKRQSPRLAPPLIGKRLSVWGSEYDSST